MLALSIKQPWAWLIVNGYKDVENRDWSTRFRGQFLVHAGKTFDMPGYSFIITHWPEIVMPNIGDFLLGGIVGQAEIYDCVDFHESAWFMGEYGFLIRNAKPLPFVPLRGQLGFFNVEVQP